MNSRLLEMLVCPATKTKLVWRAEESELWCRASRLAYPVVDDEPIMVESEARELTDSEVESLRT